MSSSNINLEQFFSDTTQLRTEAAKSFDNAILVFKKSNSFSDRNGKAYCINFWIILPSHYSQLPIPGIPVV